MRGAVVVAALLGLAAAPAAANASQLIDRNAKNIRLAVNTKGEALLTYRVGTRVRRILAWGAVDAYPPSRTPQTKLKLDYSGGWGKYRRAYWKTFGNACRPYDGPPLDWKVLTCKAPDGSYWAIQSWQRQLPNYGLQPNATQAVWELRLSHWTGELPVLEITANWAFRGRFDHIFGRFTYRGHPVYGFASTPAGVPLDTYGRNIYVDTFNSAYGPGWKRENSFLTHTGRGTFCYGFYRHGDRPVGKGERYRATVIGPGITPDVMWQSAAPGPHDQERDAVANEKQRQLEDPLCRQG